MAFVKKKIGVAFDLVREDQPQMWLLHPLILGHASGECRSCQAASPMDVKGERVVGRPAGWRKAQWAPKLQLQNRCTFWIYVENVGAHLNVNAQIHGIGRRNCPPQHHARQMLRFVVHEQTDSY